MTIQVASRWGSVRPSAPSRTQTMSEMIGRATPETKALLQSMYPSGVTVDWTQSDYAWWDKLRRGKQTGYELGGLFSEPIAAILSDWTLGKGFDAMTGDAYTDAAINEFINTNLDELIAWDYNAISLADGYLAVNPDGTLTELPPNTVRKHVNRLDYRDVTGYTVTSKPEAALLITDQYWIKPTAVRYLKVENGGEVEIDETYQLLVDRLPIIALHNKRGTNELYGHPQYEGLRTLFAEYHDVLRKGLDGVKLMGHPIPVIEGAENPQNELDNNKTGTVELLNDDGTYDTVPVIDIAKIFMLILGKGASFNFKSPGAFTQDAGRLLEYLFLLMLQRSRIPEWVWGGAIASSKASVDSQGPAFVLFIQGRQRMMTRAITDLINVWLQYRSLVDPRIKTGLPLTFSWPDVLPPDEQRRLDWVKLLLDKGAMSLETALQVSNLVQDPAAELAKAQQEQQDREALQEAAIQREIERMANESDDQESVDGESEDIAA